MTSEKARCRSASATRRASTSRCRRGGEGRRVNERIGADVLGHELGVLAQAVAGALDLDDDSMVEQAVEQPPDLQRPRPIRRSRDWR